MPVYLIIGLIVASLYAIYWNAKGENLSTVKFFVTAVWWPIAIIVTLYWTFRAIEDDYYD